MYVFAYYLLPPIGSKLHEGKKFVSFVPGYLPNWASQVAQWKKNLPANAGDARDVGLIPGSGRSHGVANGNSLQ